MQVSTEYHSYSKVFIQQARKKCLHQANGTRDQHSYTAITTHLYTRLPEILVLTIKQEHVLKLDKILSIPKKHLLHLLAKISTSLPVHLHMDIGRCHRDAANSKKC